MRKGSAYQGRCCVRTMLLSTCKLSVLQCIADGLGGRVLFGLGCCLDALTQMCGCRSWGLTSLGVDGSDRVGWWLGAWGSRLRCVKMNPEGASQEESTPEGCNQHHRAQGVQQRSLAN